MVPFVKTISQHFFTMLRQRGVAELKRRKDLNQGEEEPPATRLLAGRWHAFQGAESGLKKGLPDVLHNLKIDEARRRERVERSTELAYGHLDIACRRIGTRQIAGQILHASYGAAADLPSCRGVRPSNPFK